jgi:hypothetical protein
MRVVEALQISGRGLVVVTDVKLREVGQLGISVRPGMKVVFDSESGRQLISTVKALELFSSPFNPNKPFAFVLAEGLAKSDLPAGTQVVFPRRPRELCGQ